MFENGCYLRRQKRFKDDKKEALRQSQRALAQDSTPRSKKERAEVKKESSSGTGTGGTASSAGLVAAGNTIPTASSPMSHPTSHPSHLEAAPKLEPAVGADEPQPHQHQHHQHQQHQHQQPQHQLPDFYGAAAMPPHLKPDPYKSDPYKTDPYKDALYKDPHYNPFSINNIMSENKAGGGGQSDKFVYDLPPQYGSYSMPYPPASSLPPDTYYQPALYHSSNALL